MKNILIIFLMSSLIACPLTASDIQHVATTHRAVIFDIDGTLTPKPFAVFTARPYAATAVHLFANNGYHIIYLSARIPLLQANIPHWLKENHFPKGSLHVPQTFKDHWDHAAFKTKILKTYQEKGWQLIAAYGDSSTDFTAYVNVGIKKEHIFALQRKGYIACQAGVWKKCLTSWSQHLATIKQLTVN